MEFMTIKEAAEKWNLSVRRVQTICNEGMIEGAKQLRNAGWDIVARNEYLPNSIDGTAIRIQFKISGLSKIKDILTEINEEGKHDRNDGFKTASKASQFDFLD